IISNNLAHPLRVHNWKGFAKGYNGPAYAENQYDTKLAAFFAKYVLNPPDLRMRALQAALAFLGFNPGPVDGLPGKRTRAAVSRFQASRHLPVTGVIDGTTEAQLLEAAFPAVAV